MTKVNIMLVTSFSWHKQMIPWCWPSHDLDPIKVKTEISWCQIHCAIEYDMTYLIYLLFILYSRIHRNLHFTKVIILKIGKTNKSPKNKWMNTNVTCCWVRGDLESLLMYVLTTSFVYWRIKSVILMTMLLRFGEDN